MIVRPEILLVSLFPQTQCLDGLAISLGVGRGHILGDKHVYCNAGIKPRRGLNDEFAAFSSDRQLLDVEANKEVLKNGAKGLGVSNIQAFLHLIGHRLPKSIKQGQPDGVFGLRDRKFRQEVSGRSGFED